MTLTPELSNGLKIATGICWTIAYILIIRRGHLEKTYGMPFFALCANITWEFIFSFLLPHSTPQRYIDIVWFVFDAVIVYEFLRYGKNIFAGTMLEKWFYPVLIAVLVGCFVGIYTMTLELEPPDNRNGKYVSFIQNLVMSLLFIEMLIRRNSSIGQSIYIAIFKMLGTMLISLLFYLRAPELPFSLFLYTTIFIVDLIYTIMVYSKLRQENINPWRRF